MAPGPNDHHVVFADRVAEDGTKTKVPTLEPGLGKDEPSDAVRAGARDAATKRLEQLKKEVAAAGDEVEEKRLELEAQKAELAAERAELEAQRREFHAAQAAMASDKKSR